MTHPSVIIFAFFNEGASHHPESAPAYAAMASALRSRNTGRLVSWASNRVNASIGWSRGLPDLNLHLADVVSFNWYPGWYECHVPGALHPPTPAGPNCLPPTPEKWWQDKAEWAANAWPQKPFLISETGAAGIAGWHNGTAIQDFALHCVWPGRDEPCWSEEFQRVIVASDVAAVTRPQQPAAAIIAGISIWQFADSQDNRGNCTSAAECNRLDTYRPHALNSKGMLTGWRQPKESYHAVSALFTKATE